MCRFHMAGDHGPLTCSHLESYDPDRALTDYISRLEALQRRLGSVTSGAFTCTSSYCHLSLAKCKLGKPVSPATFFITKINS